MNPTISTQPRERHYEVCARCGSLVHLDTKYVAWITPAMETSVMTIVIGLSVGIGTAIAMSRQNKKNQNLAALIEPVLRSGGAMTLPTLAQTLGMGGFYARGKVVLALNELCVRGVVEVVPAPAGTPQLQKVNHIQYRWKQ